MTAAKYCLFKTDIKCYCFDMSSLMCRLIPSCLSSFCLAVRKRLDIALDLYGKLKENRWDINLQLSFHVQSLWLRIAACSYNRAQGQSGSVSLNCILRRYLACCVISRKPRVSLNKQFAPFPLIMENRHQCKSALRIAAGDWDITS